MLSYLPFAVLPCNASLQCFLTAQYILVLYHCDMVYCAVLHSALCAVADTYWIVGNCSTAIALLILCWYSVVLYCHC